MHEDCEDPDLIREARLAPSWFFAVVALVMVLVVIPFLMGLFERIGPTLWTVVRWFGGGVQWVWGVAYSLGSWTW